MSATTPPAREDALRVLIVDDDFLFTQMLPKLLRKCVARPSLDIITASTADDAIAHITSRRLDVVLCDFDLRTPQTGLDVLRHATSVQHPPLRVLVSGHARRDIPSSPEGTVDAFLEKPMTLREILPQLASLLRDALGVECELAATTGPAARR